MYWKSRVAIAALSLALAASVGTASAADAPPPVVQTVAPARLVVPAIGVDAQVVQLGLKAGGEMDAPDGPYPVGWYTFSPTPGNPGNTVFSGHRDWYTGVTGVFWRLGDLAPGDAIAVVLADGSRVRYKVALNVLIGPDDMPIADVVGPTTEETITLITCDGTFDGATRDYDRRRVIWGSRVT